MMQKQLSVIIPVYNVDSFLEKCIDSVIGQTYRNLEIILVDDGSTDRSSQICDAYAKIDKRIKVIHKKNGGLVSARQEGLRNASGYYTAFVDGDDWVDLDMYAYLISEMEQSDAEIVTSGFYKECGESSSLMLDGLDDGVYVGDSAILCRNMIFKDKLAEYSITSNIWNKIFITAQVKKYYLCIDTNICYGEDAACVYAYIPYAKKIRVIHKAFYHYRFRSDSVVHTNNTKILYQIGLLYTHLLKAFEEHENFLELKRQLSIFITLNTFRGLNYYIGFEDDLKIPLYMIPGKIYSFGTKIVLYGAGMVGQEYERQLRVSKDGELVLWIDKMAEHYRKKGKDVRHIEDILSVEYDVILLAISDRDMVREIKRELINLGISENKIYWELPRTIIEQYICL